MERDNASHHRRQFTTAALAGVSVPLLTAPAGGPAAARHRAAHSSLGARFSDKSRTAPKQELDPFFAAEPDEGRLRGLRVLQRVWLFSSD